MTSTGAFTTEHVDGVLTISFDDGKANTLNTDRLRELHSLIDGAAADGTTAIVIRGRERMFSAGLDVKWLATLDGDGLIELSQVFSSTMLVPGVSGSGAWPKRINARCACWLR